MEKKEIIAKFAAHEGDTGSPEVQMISPSYSPHPPRPKA